MAGRETPATAAARRAGIRFRVHEYEHRSDSPSFGLEAAEKLGVDPARVFKTLVAKVDARLAVCVVPVACQLDLKAIGKRPTMAEPGEAERATGYVVGGISPLGQRKRLATLLDASALEHETIFVSAGRRGLEVELAPADLVSLTGATVVSLAR